MAQIRIRRAEARDQDWIVRAHTELYTRDEGFDDTFGPLVASVLSRFFANHDEQAEAGFVAEAISPVDGAQANVVTGGVARAEAAEPLGCVFVMREDADTARLRLFLLRPEARGQGLGQRLHDTLLRFASAAGYGRIVLSTHESHRAACALYLRNDWKILSRKPVRSFGNDLIELALSKNL